MVLEAEPGGGTQARKGSTVTIAVGVLGATTTTPDDHDHHADHDHDATTPPPAARGRGEPRGERPTAPLTVAVLAGGRSSEHEVSLSSARPCATGCAAAGHDVLLDRDRPRRRAGAATGETLARDTGRGPARTPTSSFPVLHGPFGEDGTVQGLLETLDVAYVGAGVAASAVCMDKVLFKELMAAAGVPQVDYVGRRARALARRVRGGARARSPRSGCRCSSSPRTSAPRSGSSRSTRRDELEAALEQAFAHDALAIVEAMARGVEVECGVLGCRASATRQRSRDRLRARRDRVRRRVLRLRGQVRAGRDGAAGCPARISPRPRARGCAARGARRSRRSGCEGLARVDFFVEGERVLVNELNTMPGFTPTSVYAKLLEASGVALPGAASTASAASRSSATRASAPRALSRARSA